MSDEQGVFSQYSSSVQFSADEAIRDLSRGLAGYLRAVAEAIGVPPEGTTFEISDTATAYLALARRWPGRPGRDLMLVWGERTGWVVSVETDPGEQPMVVARLGGNDPVPEPQTVARFVTEALTSQTSAPARPAAAIEANRARLAEGLIRYASKV
ncbi:hypothetical protein JOF56_007150 [Kibdelosporangium banguiense]|uniref:DUF6292 domain-containing protein n=1 Tax=Kibdelosporangium banguiense TaxID=1365924 RepID=A0ABS4TS39_9PSEU|nr:DUF6292 family protein [Kibdelosporangium banguiense]MBP2326765.1 hypothetical protein [Kibdelosporangium banguiense]